LRDRYPEPGDVTVRKLVDLMGAKLLLSPVNDEDGYSRTVASPDISRPGLALTGFTHRFLHDRIQIFGETEITYLSSLDPESRARALSNVFQFPVYCCIVTKGFEPDRELCDAAHGGACALFRSPRDTTPLIHDLTGLLSEVFASRKSVHGTLVDVFGVGLLVTGRSAIGKSEAVLGLVERGHRLVADDIVRIRKTGEQLLGTGDTLMGYHMEIRGLGMVNVAALYGIRSIKDRQQVDMEVRLVDWSQKPDFDRTGLDRSTTTYLGIKIPQVILPVLPGRNIALLLEVAAMNFLLASRGVDVPAVLDRRLIERMQEAGG
jgi:HPr kinase/phosphorylase